MKVTFALAVLGVVACTNDVHKNQRNSLSEEDLILMMSKSSGQRKSSQFDVSNGWQPMSEFFVSAEEVIRDIETVDGKLVPTPILKRGYEAMEMSTAGVNDCTVENSDLFLWMVQLSYAEKYCGPRDRNDGLDEKWLIEHRAPRIQQCGHCGRRHCKRTRAHNNFKH